MLACRELLKRMMAEKDLQPFMFHIESYFPEVWLGRTGVYMCWRVCGVRVYRSAPVGNLIGAVLLVRFRGARVWS